MGTGRGNLFVIVFAFAFAFAFAFVVVVARRPAAERVRSQWWCRVVAVERDRRGRGAAVGHGQTDRRTDGRNFWTRATRERP